MPTVISGLGKQMALVKGYTVTYRWQSMSLHCWLTSLEMLMDWRYGTIYGVNPTTDTARTQHTVDVLWAKARQHPNQHPNALGFRAGFRHAYLVKDYGLRRTKQLRPTVATWEKVLEEGGPILLSGDYGPARVVGSHCVLAVGISGSNKIVYLDPFFIGVHAIESDHYIYMSPADAVARLQVDNSGVQQAYQAAAGATDPGNWP